MTERVRGHRDRHPIAAMPACAAPGVSIVIVNWNSGPQLAACCDSIVRHAGPLAREIIVVDNGSTDGSGALVAGRPGVELVRSPENLGFARACNLGARRASAAQLLFLNPDAQLFEGTLQSAVAALALPRNRRIGIVGVQLVDASGRVARSCARFPSVPMLLAHTVGLDRIFPKLGFAMHEWDHAQPRRVDHVIGAFYLVRRAVFDAVGGFDERFFVYLEDLDFSLRARAAGWASLFLADTRAFHAGGGTSRQIRARRLFYAQRSRLLYAFKHFGAAGALPVLLATLLVEPVSRSAFALLRRSWPTLRESWAGYLMLLGWLPRWIGRGATR